MSQYTAVSVMTGPGAHLRLLGALQEWANHRERTAEFRMLPQGSVAADADVIIGNVNYLYLGKGQESLQATIRDAAADPDGWPYWQPTGVMLLDEEGGLPKFYRLNEHGNWDTKE